MKTRRYWPTAEEQEADFHSNSSPIFDVNDAPRRFWPELEVAESSEPLSKVESSYQGIGRFWPTESQLQALALADAHRSDVQARALKRKVCLIFLLVLVCFVSWVAFL